MKKMIGIAVGLAVVLAVLRRFGPALRDRAIAECQKMFERSAGERGPGTERENLVPAAAG